MLAFIHLILITSILSTFFILALKNFKSMVKIFALQALLISFFPLLTSESHFHLESFFLTSTLILVKTFIFPWILFKALQKNQIHAENSFYLSPAKTIFLGLFALILSFWFGKQVLVQAPFSSFSVSVAFFLLLTGLFLMIARKMAFGQIVGYLIFENGIFLLALNLAKGIPLLIELGVLFDLCAGLIMMTVAVDHINKEFEHLNTHSLDQLKG